MRADLLIVQLGLAPTRSAAQRLIERGAVRVQGAPGRVLRKSGEDLAAGCVLEVTDDAELRWVSRGGLKLEGALQHTGLDPAGRDCLDVGQSTGGFTDVLLSRGAARVVGIDVGHGQLHPRLRSDPRVQALEGVNARHVEASLGRFGLIVGDLSFISLTLVLPAIAPLLQPGGGGELLMLVKPQFELQPEHIGKGGLVKSASSYPVVEQRLRAACEAHGLQVADYFESPIAGGDGNTEFFVHARSI